MVSNHDKTTESFRKMRNTPTFLPCLLLLRDDSLFLKLICLLNFQIAGAYVIRAFQVYLPEAVLNMLRTSMFEQASTASTPYARLFRTATLTASTQDEHDITPHHMEHRTTGSQGVSGGGHQPIEILCLRAGKGSPGGRGAGGPRDP